MFRALLALHQGVQYLYKTTTYFVGLLHVKELLEIVRCRAERNVNCQ